MELYLQFAYGMKQIAIDLSRDWNGTTAILSPRDISPIQLKKWQNDFEKANVKTFFDPQLYYPAAMLQYDEEWLRRWKKASLRLIDSTKKYVHGRKHILTLALPEQLLLQKEDEIEKVIEESTVFLCFSVKFTSCQEQETL